MLQISHKVAGVSVSVLLWWCATKWLQCCNPPISDISLDKYCSSCSTEFRLTFKLNLLSGLKVAAHSDVKMLR